MLVPVFVLILFVEVAIFLYFGVKTLIQIKHRKKTVTVAEGKMLNTGRVLMWFGTVCVLLMNRSFNLSFEIYFIFASVLMFLSLIGLRLYVNGLGVEREIGNTKFAMFDSWVVSLYKKHSDLLGKNKK